ncbi:MAG: hypothetical protein LBL35_03805 [Clostridiales bacterium]|jgi:hypothetical protein|nr:hypothetical protein [Clostridiales bacterium]
MSILDFLAANWDSVAVVIVMIAVVVSLIVKKQCGLLNKIAFALVTWAERAYGGSAGQLKPVAVIEKIYLHIPAIIRVFVIINMLAQLIEKALTEAKPRWESDPTPLSN